MYCIKCGTKLNQDSRFCYNCGYKVEEIINSSSDKHLNFRSETKKNNKGSKSVKLFIILLSIIIILLIKFFMSSINITNSPQTVTKNFFKAIYTEDVSLFLKCLKDGEYLDDYGDSVRDLSKIAGYLNEANDTISDLYGSNWYRHLKYEDVESFNEDELYYIKVILSQDQSSDLMIEKYEGKYYIEPYGTNRYDIDGYHDVVGR